MALLVSSRSTPRLARRFAIVGLALGGATAGCHGGSPSGSSTTMTEPATPSFKVRGSVQQIAVWKAPPGAMIEVRDAKGAMVVSGAADTLGSFVFRNVPAANDYEVIVPSLGAPNSVSPVVVTTVAGSLPPQSFYAGQHLVPGYNYITTRDGTKLAAFITLPGPADKGPYPTVVNYSGYNPGQPGAPIMGDQFLCSTIPVICDAPQDPSALITSIMGYATVGVNMRGTGCSGGSYDYFEDLQLLDGYDIIETVAAQPWVAFNKVGMTGLSYPGIAQLFVAQTHPPSLAAISPLSVIGNTYSTLRPGGIFNDGFALQWVTSVLDGAAPYGQGWEKPQVMAGDTVCEENQLLHGQAVDVIQQAKDDAYDTGPLSTPLDPTAFVSTIDVPVFMSGAFEDEETGPFFFTLLDKFTSAPSKRFTVFNGVHPDGFAPQVVVDLKAFLDIYVAHQVPAIDPNVAVIAPALFETFFQVNLPVPTVPYSDSANWEAAKAAYEADHTVRALFEDGAKAPLGGPAHTFELDFDAWPPPTTTPLRLYFHGDGTLQPTAPAAGDTSVGATYTLDPAAGHRGILAPMGNIWDPLPDYDWAAPAPGNAVVLQTPPLTSDLVMLGTGSVDLWIRSPVVNDADIQVNITEVRPDGQERYVQSGWLRASLRALAPSATDMWPEHTYAQADEAMLVPGQWTPARIGIPIFGHVFRAGSSIRIIVDTPGGSRASWTFDLKTFPGTVTYDVATSVMYPSSVLLPVLQGQTSTTPLPACPSLRAQQCRAYAPYTNTVSAP
jgi:predicted acyl esterase